MANACEGRIVEVLIGTHPPLQTLREKQESEHAAYLATTTVASVQVTLEGIIGDRHAGFTRRAETARPSIRAARRLATTGRSRSCRPKT